LHDSISSVGWVLLIGNALPGGVVFAMAYNDWRICGEQSHAFQKVIDSNRLNQSRKLLPSSCLKFGAFLSV